MVLLPDETKYGGHSSSLSLLERFLLAACFRAGHLNQSARPRPQFSATGGHYLFGQERGRRGGGGGDD